MEKDFGAWMGGLIKVLGFDRGVGGRGYNKCWIQYEVLERVELAALSRDLAVLDQAILNSDKVGANGRGSSDR